MPSSTTVTNLDSIATRTRRSIVSNTSFDSASLDGHSLFSSDDMTMAPRPKVVTSRENSNVGSSSEKKRSATAKGGRTVVEGQRGALSHGMGGKMDKRSAMDPRVVQAESAPSPLNRPGVRVPGGSSHSHEQHPSTKALSSHTQKRDTQQSSPPQKSKHISKSVAKTQPSIMMSMSALIEQNEDAILHYSMPKSNVLISSNRSRSNSTPKSSTHAPNVSPQPRRRTNPARTDLARRRSRSLENLARVSESPTPTPPQPEEPSISPPSPPRTHTSTSSRPGSQGKAGYTSSPLSRTTHSSTTRSPTSPDAFAELSVGVGTDGQLHLTKNGALQNTMTTLELSRGFPHFIANGDSKGKARAMESPFSIINSRRPPSYVPEGSVLVQVWAVGLDPVDARLCGVPSTQGSPSDETPQRNELRHGKRSTSDTKSLPGRPGGLIRTLSLSRKKTKEDTPILSTGTKNGGTGLKQPELGYTPGRSFVGRVVEVGDMDDREMGFRKGDWVVGLLDLRKCGALQEYIIVDRRRIFNVPPPALKDLTDTSAASPSRNQVSGNNPSRSRATSAASAPTQSTDSRLTIDELALLPLCGVQAYRATRTLKIDNDNVNTFKARRILILNGHDGIGALATQMLARRGWNVVVHAPGPEDKELIARVKSWSGDAVIFDGGEGPVKTMERLVEDGESLIDAILDTIGGKDIWEAGERLLKVQGQASRQQQPQMSPPVQSSTRAGITPLPPPPPPLALQSSSSLSRRFGSIRRRNTNSSTNSTVSTGGNTGSVKQFATTVGDFPDRPVPSASDHFKSGLRSMRKSGVDYTWVNLAQDIDFEGGDIRDALKRVIWMAVEEGVRPIVGGAGRVIGLERTPEVFIPGGERGLEGGNTVVVRVVE